MKYATIDEYHSSFAKNVQEKLEVVRKAIRDVIPHGKEVISYNIPAFKVNRIVVYYAAHKVHISLHPAPTDEEWQKDVEPYRTSGKGTIQFPYDQPLPIELIKKMVKHLASLDAEKVSSQK
ncbi:iron chaperone [Catalinimonas alkaloidigena]|nr:DUF1801 domain-containing protein [Catalinimonas alkaloidigena]